MYFTSPNITNIAKIRRFLVLKLHNFSQFGQFENNMLKFFEDLAQRIQNLRMAEANSKKCKTKAETQNLYPLFY